jgi:putative ubiquitin-RnfH superfamily antitoxin RatB of RatAB toxin-antitoxin module
VTDDLSDKLIAAQVVVAMSDNQVVRDVALAKGATIGDAIEQSGITGVFDDLVIDPKMVGVFGTKVTMDQELQDGDRVEIYRPLIIDPKEVRRQRALKQAKN